MKSQLASAQGGMWAQGGWYGPRLMLWAAAPPFSWWKASKAKFPILPLKNSYRGISSELWSSICHGVTAVCKVPFSSWRIYLVNIQPRHFLNMIEDKRSLTDAPPAPFLNGLIVLPWTAQLFPKAALVLPDLCSEATKKQSLGLSGCGLVDTKLSSSLLFCGLNTPASQHSPWAHKPSVPPFSLAASLKKKKCYQLPFSKLMKQNQFYGT